MNRLIPYTVLYQHQASAVTFENNTLFLESIMLCQRTPDAVNAKILQGNRYNFNGRDFKVNTNMSFKTEDGVCICHYICTGCNEYYFGDTSNTLRARVHKYFRNSNVPYRDVKKKNIVSVL